MKQLSILENFWYEYHDWQKRTKGSFIKKLPTILTTSRLILAPLITLSIFYFPTFVTIIISVILMLTDLFDGKLARHYEITSQFGSMMDTISDKFLTFCLIPLVLKYPTLLPIYLMELIIAIENLYIHSKTHYSKSIDTGRFKNNILCATFIGAILIHIISDLSFLLPYLIGATLGLQAACIYLYGKNYYLYTQEKKK